MEELLSNGLEERNGINNDLMATSSVPPPWPVLLVARELGIGGCERDLTKIAKGIDRSRFEPHVACFHPHGLRAAELEAAGIPIVHLPVTSFLSLSAWRGARVLRNYIRQNRIQIIQSFDVPLDLFAVPLGRLFGVPVVIASQLGFRDLYAKRERQCLRLVDRLAHKVVVNSRAVMEHMIEDEHVPPGNLYLCYNGIEVDAFRPSSTPGLKPFGEASLIIGSVCALRPEKRLDLLLQAFAKVKSLQRGMKLVILGSGPMLAALERERNRLRLDQDCIFQPAQPSVIEWLYGMDIFVLPSSSESFPNALLEAMACGCCVIGSRVGGIPELISDRKSGLLFEPGSVADLAQKLAFAIQNYDCRKRIAAGAVEAAHTQFPMARTLQRMQDLYESLLAKRLDRPIPQTGRRSDTSHPC